MEVTRLQNKSFYHFWLLIMEEQRLKDHQNWHIPSLVDKSKLAEKNEIKGFSAEHEDLIVRVQKAKLEYVNKLKNKTYIVRYNVSILNGC